MNNRVVEHVTPRVQKYQRLLYFLNVVLLGISSFALYRVLSLNDISINGNIDIDMDAITGVLIFSIVLSLLGLWGACRAKSSVQHKNCQCTLSIYAFLCLLLLATFTAVVAMSAAGVVVTNDAMDSNGDSDLDHTIMDGISEYPDYWLKVEAELSCCGYNLHPDTRTGPTCTAPDTSKVDCRAPLLKELKSVITAVLVAGSISMFLVLVATIGSFCLVCANRSDAAEYQFMSASAGNEAVYQAQQGQQGAMVGKPLVSQQAGPPRTSYV
jgi:hypothetical protein